MQTNSTISCEKLSEQNAIGYGTGDETDFEETLCSYHILSKHQHDMPCHANLL